MDGANSCINLTKENQTFSNIMKMFPIFEKITNLMGIDPYSAVNETLKYCDLRNKGREAFLAGDYSKAERNYRKSIEISEKAFAPSDLNSIPASIGLCESYIRLKDWQQAKIIADNLMSIAKKYKHQDCIRVTVELLDEIEQSKNGQTGDKINRNCSSCKKPDAKFHCGLCKWVNYCSKECQRKDWANHKEICRVMSSPRPTCGLCGFQGSRWILITKTPCCGQWICDDVHTTELISKKLNSCTKNHSLFSCTDYLAKNASFYSGQHVSHEKCRSQEEIEWKEFCDKHFVFKNVTEKERQRNREMKTDGSSTTSKLPIQLPDIKKF